MQSYICFICVREASLNKNNKLFFKKKRMTSSMLQKSIIVKYKLTLPNAKKPTLATPGSAGYDAYSCQDVVILPGECKQIDIGIAIEMPEGIMLQLHNRSSIGKRMINLQCGIIDSDYRGSISVILANYGREPFSGNF